MALKNGILVKTGAAALALVLVFGTFAAASGSPRPEGQTSAASTEGAAAAGDRFTLKEAGREFLGDAGRIWSSPARIQAKHILPLAGLAAATAVLIASDESIRDGVQTFAGKHAWVGDVAPMVTELGGWAGFATAGAFFGAGLVFKDVRARDTGYLAANAIVQSFLVDNLLKSMTGRQRPFVAEGQDHWAGPAGFFKRFEKGQASFYTAFPSGHTAVAFSLATVIAMQYRHHAWIPVVAYTLATGVGLSRVALDRHWASDVFVGAVVGHFVARLIVRNHDKRRRVVPMLACTGRAAALSVFVDLD